jgi:hypothetical protein
VSEWVSAYCLTPKWAIFQVYSWWQQVTFWWDDDDVRFVLDQNAELDFCSARLLKQQSAGRHVSPLGHIIPIPSQPVFDLTLSFYVLTEEATNANLLVFDLTRTGLEPTIYRTWAELANHYTGTDACGSQLFELSHNENK